MNLMFDFRHIGMFHDPECVKRLSLATRLVRYLRRSKMAYFWTAIVSALAAFVLYCQVPLVVFPFLLFVTFLASGGRSFPRVFFRTIVRDIRGFSRYLFVIIATRQRTRNKQTVADIFQETVAKHPQKIAFVFEQKTWTFQEVENYSNRMANYFHSLGYQKGDVVALFLESCPEFACTWLGLSKLGVITALINTSLRLDSLWHCISVANVQAIIFATDLSGAIKEIQNRIPEKCLLLSLGNTSNAVASAVNLTKKLEESSPGLPAVNYPKSIGDVLLYIYTSGTTGLPKAAVITNFRFFRMSYGVSCALAVRHDDILYTSLPLYHSAGGILGVGQCFFMGCTVVLRRKFSASKFWDDCVEAKATVIQYIGELCRYLMTQPQRPSETQHSVRLAIGNGLRPQIWKEFQSRFGIKQIGEFYGSTEGTASIINIDSTPGSCGFVSEIIPKVYPVVVIKVDPETGEIARGSDGLAIKTQPGEVGQIVGKSKSGDPSFRFDGYLNPMETSKKIGHDIFKKGDSAFLSGDLVVKDEYGYIYFHDRTGDTFRWRGENVSTAEVESVMSKVLGLRDVVVYGVMVPGTEGRAGMAAIGDPANTIDVASLAQNLKKLLPSYACPIFLRILHAVDLTGTFKLQKCKLKKEGFDVGVIEDQLLYLDPKERTYLTLTNTKYEQIVRGEIRI